MTKLRTIDLFCGAGGSSWGARSAGMDIVAGFDKWDLAGKVYKDNFPEAKIYSDSLEKLDVNKVKADLGEIDIILASPECTNHSPAKGNRPRCEKSKETAFQVTRFAAIFKPKWMVIENVVSMRNWSRYSEFISEIRSLGYNLTDIVLTSSDFSVPQKRRRLFIICSLKDDIPLIKPNTKSLKLASSIIDQNGTYPYTPLYTKKRAVATLQRAERAISQVGYNVPFLIVYYGSDHAGGWQSLDSPLRTITTLDRFAFVKPTKDGHEMRMLQVPELKKAMGMPQKFLFKHGTRRDRIKMVGNAVCPPVMRNLIKKLTNT